LRGSVCSLACDVARKDIKTETSIISGRRGVRGGGEKEGIVEGDGGGLGGGGEKSRVKIRGWVVDRKLSGHSKSIRKKKADINVERNSLRTITNSITRPRYILLQKLG